ncbi:MAG: cytochrome c-type biogenesis protein [Acidimicrobiales bacterium]
MEDKSGIKPAGLDDSDHRANSGLIRASSKLGWLELVSLLVVVAVALLIGSGAFSGARLTNSERARSIESGIRCPSCEDVSVADSTVSTSIAVRHEITKMVAAGYSDTQIRDSLVSQYGPTILLRPPTSGLVATVWVVPALAGFVAVVGIGVFFWRRSAEFDRLKRGR